MKQLIFFFIFSTIGFLFGENENFVEFRSSAFFHSGKKMREVYGAVSPTFGVEASRYFCGQYGAWINLDFAKQSFEKSCCSSNLWIINTSFGLKYICPLICRFDFYLGIGPAFSAVNLKNDTCCEKEQFSKFAVGGVLKTGIYYRFYQDYYLDIFIDYLYQTVNIEKSIDISGAKFGLGLGVQF